jgi:hypothetical protein
MEPNLDFLKNREDLAPWSLYTMTPSGKDFIRLFRRKNMGSAPMLHPIRNVENVETSMPRPQASH